MISLARGGCWAGLPVGTHQGLSWSRVYQGISRGNGSLIALRQKYFRGGDGLSHVALGMFRDMDKKSRYRGWQIFSADRARFLQRCGGCTEFAGAVGAQSENFCLC